MTEPKITDELATPTAAEAKARSRFGFRGRRSAGRVLEENSVVQRPSTVIFQASPTTIGASLAKAAGDTTEPIIVWGPGTAAHPEDGTTLAKGLAAATPVFVIGAGPDERELLRLALGSHPNLSSAPENGLLAELANSVRDNRDSLAYHGYPEQYWYKSAGEQFATLQATRAASEHKGRWVALVDASQLPLETLDRMFPTARIVHVVSDGWPRRNVRTLRGQAVQLSGGRYLEVRGRDLESDPATVKQAVLEFLGEPLDTVDGGTAA